MNQITTYQTLKSPIQAEFKDKGSRFLAFAYPVLTAEQVKKHVDDLRQEHHKARHWCYAYRLGVDGNQFRANDDGEPSGSAGRPILGQIDSFELTDVLVVVVRYFGGTLLGVPGLIHAYKTSTQMVLENAQIIEKNIEKIFSERLRELNFGNIEGKTYTEIENEFPHYIDEMKNNWRYFKTDGGESLFDLQKSSLSSFRYWARYLRYKLGSYCLSKFYPALIWRYIPCFY